MKLAALIALAAILAIAPQALADERGVQEQDLQEAVEFRYTQDEPTKAEPVKEIEEHRDLLDDRDVR